VRIRARTTSNLRARLLRTRRNNDFTVGIEKSIRPSLLPFLRAGDFECKQFFPLVHWEPETPRAADNAFADRARMLIRRGYTPKVAVELVLHEMEFEQGNNSKTVEKARVDAEEFLMRARRGLI